MGRLGESDSRRVLLEVLENRNLLSTINAGDFGAVPDDGADDGAAIQRALDAAQPGDTVRLTGGTFDLSDELNIEGGTSLLGSNAGQTVLRGKAGQVIALLPMGDNVLISSVKLDGVGIESNVSGLKVLDNDITNSVGAKYKGPGTGTPLFLFGGRNIRIEHNYIHDTDVWGYDVACVGDISISYNIFKNVYQGGHLERPLGKAKIDYNLMTGLIRMGHEIQSNGGNPPVSVGGEVVGNVIYGWRRFDNMWNSFGLSIVSHQKDWVIRDNYIRGDYLSTGPVSEMGMGIEIGGYDPDKLGTPTMNNIIGGTKFRVFMCAAQKNTMISGNKLYGKALWGDITGETGGTFIDKNNLRDPDFNHMPPPPTIPGVGPRSANEVDDSAPDLVYISDLKRASSGGSMGVISIDQTHGGGQIWLNKKRYDKGIGVAGNSEVTYNLDGKYTRFYSDIGINDHVGDDGSVVFQVWADGKKVYDSGIMTGRTLKKGITIKVDGVKTLKLVTTDAGDGTRYDQAVWAAARLIPA